MFRNSDEIAHEVLRRRRQLRFAQWGAGFLWLFFLLALAIGFRRTEMALVAQGMATCAVVFSVGAFVRARILAGLRAEAWIAGIEAVAVEKAALSERHAALASRLFEVAGIDDAEIASDLDRLVVKLRQSDSRARCVRRAAAGLWLAALGVIAVGGAADISGRLPAWPFIFALFGLMAAALTFTVSAYLRWNSAADLRLEARLARLHALERSSKGSA